MPPSAAAVQPIATSKSSYTDIPNSEIRSVLAKKLTESKTTIPHIYASTECAVDNLQKMKHHLKERDIVVSHIFSVFIIRI